VWACFPPRLVATITAIIFTIVGQLTVANWSSLSFPRKLEFGQMRGQRQSGMAVLVAFGSQILTGGISAVILLAGRWGGKSMARCRSLCVAGGRRFGWLRGVARRTHPSAERKKEVLIEALCR